MKFKHKNVFDYRKINQINLNINGIFQNKMLIQNKRKNKNNQRHSKIINFILIEITLTILSKINGAFGYIIEIKVNQEGENQIISEKYNGALPDKIYVNNIQSSMNDKKVYIDRTQYSILLKWNNPVSNFSYMFYNCKTISTIIFDISYNNNNISSSQYKNYNPTDLSHVFYNCTSLTYLKLSYFNTNSVKEINYMFYNCKYLSRIELIDNNKYERNVRKL